MTNLFLGFNRDGLRLKCVTFAETNNRSPPASLRFYALDYRRGSELENFSCVFIHLLPNSNKFTRLISACTLKGLGIYPPFLPSGHESEQRGTQRQQLMRKTPPP